MQLVVVKLNIEGTHRWMGCNMKNVLYLINEHRHVFFITAKKRVAHNDREIECITFKHELQSYLLKRYGVDNVCNFGEMSCEMIAEELLQTFDLDACEVLEDNENGAEITK